MRCVHNMYIFVYTLYILYKYNKKDKKKKEKNCDMLLLGGLFPYGTELIPLFPISEQVCERGGGGEITSVYPRVTGFW